MLLHLQARRFFCGNDACAKTTFAEQVPGLSVRYGRRTCGLDGALRAVALALGGLPGARLTGRLACVVSRPALLRLIRAAPDPDSGTTLVLGVDDFALRKGLARGGDGVSGPGRAASLARDLAARRESSTLDARIGKRFAMTYSCSLNFAP